jgi:acetylornithine deacetylase
LTRIQACRWPADPTFGETTCNIGVISGGTRPNVIPDEAHALLQVRVSTNQQQIKTMLEQATAAVAEVEYLSAHDPVRLLALDGFEHCVVRFTTDIPYLSNWGKALLLGPGSIFVAHTDNECIAKSEIQRAINLYVELVKRLASENARTTVVGH